MRHRSLAVLALTLTTALAAQEPPRPPEPPPAPGRLEPAGAWNLIARRRARLGLSINMLARETDSIGAWVQSVVPNGPAARAGIRSGDILTRFNGKALTGSEGRGSRDMSAPGLALVTLAAGLEPGDTAVVQLRRGREARTVRVVAGDEPTIAWENQVGGFGFAFGDSQEELHAALRRLADSEARQAARLSREGDSLRAIFEPGRRETDSVAPRMRSHRPPPALFAIGTPFEDFELAPLNPDLGRYFGTSEGILVISVPEGGGLGLRGGDVVLRVDGRTPAGPAHLLRILRSYQPGEAVRFEILRMKKRETVTGRAGP